MYQAFEQPADDAKTVLIVEDQIEMRAINAMYLHHHGYRVVAADNGIDGLKAARETHPDLIMMDMSMPEMDGWTLTRLLKDDPVLSSIPVIAVTSHAMREDQRRAKDVGCDAYMSKPIDYFKLNEMVQRYLAHVHMRARTVN